ncbi:hypothetical protein EDD22DRAFT_843216 [Suillus occidentalis]|nr:hypothetical protein EDD22DRAFT_843216 [Suillus occidentalis]
MTPHASNTSSNRSVRDAKEKAMENAVWMTTKSRRQHPTGGKLSQPGAPAQHKTKVSATTKHHVGRSSSTSSHALEIPGPGARKRPVSQAKRRRVAKLHTVSDFDSNSDDDKVASEPSNEISDFQPDRDDSEQENESDMEDVDDELEEPIDSVVKSLSTEMPIFVSMSKAEQDDFPLTQATWPCTAASKKSTQTAEPFPFPSSQPRARVAAPQKATFQSAHDCKRADEMPVWADGIAKLDEEHEAKIVPDERNDLEGSPEVDLECHDTGLTRHGHSGSARLIRTNTGKLKLTDQDIDTRRVVQRAILEAKVHITFVNRYPELTEKSLFMRNTLSTAARACGVPPIQDRLKSDDSYVTALATLVEARVPLFRSELKDDACAQVPAYYCLGPNCVDTAKALLVNHVYHYEQCFNENNTPIAQSKKPYLADILPYLMKGRYFNGPKSVGMKFSDRFEEIASNKAQRPEVTIPMVALTSTSVYAALLWKANGSPSKFNFTGNLFSEVYFFHVKLLEKMREAAPGKFHKMMADIFGAIQKLCANGNAAIVGSHDSAMAFLDLDGMDDEE